MKQVRDNCQLSFKIKASVPTNFLIKIFNDKSFRFEVDYQVYLLVLTKFHRKPLRFCEIKSLMVVVSADNLDSISPVLTLSKNPMS